MVADLFEKIFTQDIPLLDVRAPIEFQQGAFPGAVNCPILNDAERENIGICYKQDGPEAATALGHKLVSGEIRESRIGQWQAFFAQHEEAYLYCFRGGQRSQIAQQWLEDQGISVHRIDGGYKKMRTYLLAVFESLPSLVVVSGKTGVGKTEFLKTIDNAVDLEGRANHRGSAFGKRATEQPSQINFENAVAIDFLKLKGTVVVEDEGRLIGRLNLPNPLQLAMKQAPIVLLEDSLENRVQRIFREYVVEGLQDLEALNIDNPLDQLQIKYNSSLAAIQKRLGNVGYDHIAGLMSEAFSLQREGQNHGHLAWIEALLSDYYDPMYDYQIEQKIHRLEKSGDQDTLRKYLAGRNHD